MYKNGKLLKEELIKKQIYVATYWNASNLNFIEQNIQENLVALPIDHRYGIKEMNTIKNILEDLL